VGLAPLQGPARELLFSLHRPKLALCVQGVLFDVLCIV